MLQSTVWQRVRHDLATEQQQMYTNHICVCTSICVCVYVLYIHEINKSFYYMPGTHLGTEIFSPNKLSVPRSQVLFGKGEEWEDQSSHIT